MVLWRRGFLNELRGNVGFFTCPAQEQAVQTFHDQTLQSPLDTVICLTLLAGISPIQTTGCPPHGG